MTSHFQSYYAWYRCPKGRPSYSPLSFQAGYWIPVWFSVALTRQHLRALHLLFRQSYEISQSSSYRHSICKSGWSHGVPFSVNIDCGQNWHLRRFKEIAHVKWSLNVWKQQKQMRFFNQIAWILLRYFLHKS